MSTEQDSADHLRTIEWGPEIPVNGKRPEWLKDDATRLAWKGATYTASPLPGFHRLRLAPLVAPRFATADRDSAIRSTKRGGRSRASPPSATRRPYRKYHRPEGPQHPHIDTERFDSPAENC